ncbi:PRD domain-containing protein [Rathayibacter sp. Leaf296]|uniref:PRD domain-containing protein n=1 Tax=Rathayibacter sp. Leaf296 TaxID=1736327 RepID=UPI0007028367|nr:PRD domain-containing protein [Rathayibacter sp. Leaf296]KQQ08499.1 hypothetical protein ASF46_14465 [Rathayibacter sp. Leaf296]
MRTIKKIHNNNIVSAVDADGNDVVLVGAGVGYLASKGTEVDETRVEREFHGTGLAMSGSFRVLLEVPFPVLRATARVSEMLRTQHGIHVPPTVEFGLADHVSAAISRLRLGVPIANPMLWETKATYPQEFAMSLQALGIIQDELGQRLPLDEAGFITLHLANAGLIGDPHRALTLSAAIREIVLILEADLGIRIDGTSPGSIRFVSHLKFLVQRVTRTTTYDRPLSEHFAQLGRDHPLVRACADRIADFLDRALGEPLSREERLYLLVHLLRLVEESTAPTSDGRTGA